MASDSPRLTETVAAIDAGSNGLRLAIARLEGESWREIEAFREPVRLGADAFARGCFGEATLSAATAAFERFAARIAACGGARIRAVATSAAREAENARELVERIRAATGISLEVIDGLEEAQLVLAGVASTIDLTKRSAVLVDMGGGSLEVTVAKNGLALGCETLALGAVRLLTQLRAEGKLERDVEDLIKPFSGAIASLIRVELKDKTPDVCVGTGGNLESLGRLRGPLLGKQKLGKVKVSDLDPMITTLLDMTPAERCAELGLRPDRADVIAIAAIVLRSAMREIGAPKILTPGVGLNQGLLRQLASSIGDDR